MRQASIFFILLFFYISAMTQYTPLYDHIPNYTECTNKENILQANGILRISNISKPGYQFFKAKDDKKKRPCIIVCPGGGYSVVAAQHGGTDVAKYLNEMGLNVLLLKYRLPDSLCQVNKSIAPLQDVQQAMYLARRNSKEWGIKSNQIGIMGFSAGGHLAASLSSHYMDIKIENKEGLSLRPDFQILIYPVISFKDFGHPGSRTRLIGTNPSEADLNYFSNENHVNRKTPKTFIVHAKDDKTVPVKNAEIYDEALRKNKVASFLFLFEKGGHGFGLINKTSEQQWPEMLKNWLIKQKIL